LSEAFPALSGLKLKPTVSFPGFGRKKPVEKFVNPEKARLPEQALPGNLIFVV
jgi:hypothetical protein